MVQRRGDRGLRVDRVCTVPVGRLDESHDEAELGVFVPEVLGLFGSGRSAPHRRQGQPARRNHCPGQEQSPPVQEMPHTVG